MSVQLRPGNTAIGAPGAAAKHSDFRQDIIEMHRRKEKQQKDNTVPLTPGQERQQMAHMAIKSPWFDVVIGLVILLNAVAISVEQSLEIQSKSTTGIQVVETLFLIIYVVEFGLRWFVWGRRCLKDNWVKFDVLLILQGLIFTLVIEPASEATEAGPLMLLRMFRLLRLGKTARLFARIQSFWMLIRGLMQSAGMVIYSCIILFLMLWIASTVAVELITKKSLETNDAELKDHVDRYFSNLPHTMLTLLQFVFVDDASQVYRPLIEKDVWLVFYFVGVLVLFAVVLMNLISAVFFASVIDQNAREMDEAKKDQEQNWSELIADLKTMFLRLDEDQSGVLTRDEVVNMTEEDQIVLQEALGVHSAVDIFNMLDVSHTGKVSLNEFFDSIVDTILSKGSVDLKRMERQVETMHWRLKEIFVAVHELQRGVSQDTKDVHSCVQDLKISVEACREAPGTPEFSKGLGKTAPEWAQELNKTLQSIWMGTLKLASKPTFAEFNVEKANEPAPFADAKSLPAPKNLNGIPSRSPSRLSRTAVSADIVDPPPRVVTKESTNSTRQSQGGKDRKRSTSSSNALRASSKAAGAHTAANGTIDPHMDSLRSSGDASLSTGAPEQQDKLSSGEGSIGGPSGSTMQPDIDMSAPDEVPEQPGVHATHGTHWANGYR